MNKRIYSTLALFALGIAFVFFAYLIGKTVEQGKPALEKVKNDLERKVEEEVKDSLPDGSVKGEQAEQEITVVRIIDGDTLVISTGETVRLIGIDAPERQDCYSGNSTSKLTELVLNKPITVERDKEEKDRFGRTLLYVWQNGVFVNELLAKEGYADSKRYPPNIKYAPVFEAAEEEAKSKKIGIWGNECL